MIGVGAYRNVTALPNPPNDARDLAAALRRLDFEVEDLLDPDRAAMEAALRRFGGRLAGADAALFYYAGHAIEAGGRNWLVPATAEIAREADLRWETIDAEGVLAQMGAARLSIVVLDACRDNPFRTRMAAGGRSLAGRGLAPAAPATGMLIAYATAPGEIAADGEGRNSPFTAALLRHIETPGLELRQLFAEVRREVLRMTAGRQVSWDSSSLLGAFYFRPAPAPPPPPAIPEALVRELRDWERVRDSREAGELRRFLDRHPAGIFAEEARRRIERLAQQQAAPSPAAERASAAETREAVLARMLPAVPRAPKALAEAQLRDYLAAPPQRAFAVAPARRRTYRSEGYADVATAEEATLERCQLLYAEPCLLVAVGDQLRTPAPGTDWAPRDMPRLRHAGSYDPERIPALTAERRRAPDVAGYGATPGPKAMALHHWGRPFAVTGALSQHAAEAGALAACNDDPERKGRDGPCLLYAADDRVVLPERAETPIALAPGPLPPAALAALPFAPAGAAVERELRRYLDSRPHRAMAANPEQRGTWRLSNRASAAEAEEGALEACQLRFGTPCVTVAVDDAFRPPPAPGAAWPRRDMPRLGQAGAFAPERIPALSAARRGDPDLAEYRAAPGPKAAALHPWGRIFLSMGLASQPAAEAEALRLCNEDPLRKGRDGPCTLYAAGNEVVLPQRRTAPPPGR